MRYLLRSRRGIYSTLHIYNVHDTIFTTAELAGPRQSLENSVVVPKRLVGGC